MSQDNNSLTSDSIQMELLSVDSPAKTSALQESVEDLLANARDYFLKSYDSLKKQKPSGSSSKMYPVYCHQMEEGIWESSSGRWLNSGMGSRTGFLTLNTLEYPNAVVESSLSDVLEMTGEHLQKYSLSAKAAQGILRRANKRGKVLPEQLQKALEHLVNQALDNSEMTQPQQQ